MQSGPADVAADLLNPRTLPTDLKVIFIWLIGTVACIYLPFIQDSPLRIIFGLPLILFLPGYILIAALFPAEGDLDWIDRIALSIGLSIAIVSFIGLGLNYTPWGIRLNPIIISLFLFACGMMIIAAYRRNALPEEKRFKLPIIELKRIFLEDIFPQPKNQFERALVIILIIGIIVATGTAFFFIVFPKEGDRFTEFYILGEKGKAADFPTHFPAGAEQQVIIGIGNHEYRNIVYTVQIYGFNQEFDTGSNSSMVISSILLGSYQLHLAHNETIEQPFFFTIDDTNINKIQFLLFKEEMPSPGLSPAELITRSYHDLHLWVTVTKPRG